MIDRLRFLLDRPLDPLVARAIVVSATAILLGFAALFVLAVGEPGRSAAPGRQAVPTQPQAARSFGAARAEAAPPAPRASHRRRQDPQDEKGSPAAKRATKALRSHRALQHVPYRRARLSVRLGRGARRPGRARRERADGLGRPPRLAAIPAPLPRQRSCLSDALREDWRTQWLSARSAGAGLRGW